MPALDIRELAPWLEYRLPASPFPGTWGFNPSIVRVPDGDHAHAGQWLCVMRCANYHLPGSGAQANSTGTRSGVANRIQNRNWIMRLDPDNGWNPTYEGEIVDASDVARAVAARGPNAPSNHVLGYEDLRLAWSPSDGLIASATTMACNNDGVLEIAVCELGRDYQIETVQPLRGRWSERHQKNWMPMLGGERVCWLYSPEGGVHDRSGCVVPPGRRPAIPQRKATGMSSPIRKPSVFQHGAQTVQLMPGRAKVAPPRQTPLALRGGTQLVPVPEIGPDRYLGLVHGCEVGLTKYYLHRVALFGMAGDLLAISPEIKLSPEHGIEFAAGLARDPSVNGDRMIVTYGVEDDSARLAETSAEALIATLEDVS